MKLTFLGAAGEVTGSSYLLEADGKRFLIDFGVFQGRKLFVEKNVIPPHVNPATLNAVIVTHAHYDHVGRLPLLAKSSFRGPIYSTHATKDFADLILQDSARVQMSDIKRENRRRERSGLPMQTVLFGEDDATEIVSRFKSVDYHQSVQLSPNVSITFYEAGHIMGSASVEFRVQEDRLKRLIFSGDVGPRGAAVLRDPETFTQGDCVVLESTYGNRNHKPLVDTLAEAYAIVEQAVSSGGKMLMPVFAVGRAQQMIYYMAALFETGRVKPFPIFLDSPMAIRALELYEAHSDLFDEEAKALLEQGVFQKELPTLKLSITAAESIALNKMRGPCLILAGAGMANAGRILHHLKHNLHDPSTHVLFVGYQAEGTLGRLLIDGRTSVNIMGQRIAVRAKIHTLGGFSAHADRNDLLNWLRPMAAARPRVVLTHGEDDARRALGETITSEFGCAVDYPQLFDTITI